MRYRLAWLTSGWLLVGLVVYLSLTPHPPEPLSFPYADRLEHGFAYSVLTFWFCEIYWSVCSRLIVMILLIVLGVGLEFVQGWMGFRFFDIWDMVANMFGVLTGILLVQTPLRRLFVLTEKALR